MCLFASLGVCHFLSNSFERTTCIYWNFSSLWGKEKLPHSISRFAMVYWICQCRQIFSVTSLCKRFMNSDVSENDPAGSGKFWAISTDLQSGMLSGNSESHLRSQNFPRAYRRERIPPPPKVVLSVEFWKHHFFVSPKVVLSVWMHHFFAIFACAPLPLPAHHKKRYDIDILWCAFTRPGSQRSFQFEK